MDDPLFIDADIVALSPCDGIFDDAAGADLAIAPRFLDSLWMHNGQSLATDAIAENFAALIEAKFPADHTRLNSGVMVLSGTCLSADFRRRLLAMTETAAFANEQSYITALLSESTDVSWRMLSSRYNFNARELKRVSTPDQVALLSRTVFLHYIGKVKPWSRPLRNISKTSQMIWRHYETDAFDRSDLLGKPGRLRRFVRDWI